jgi:hypothetical protein
LDLPLTKLEVVRKWKPELKGLGFAWRKGAFYLNATQRKPLELMVYVQRNLYEDTYKIGTCINLNSPFAANADSESFLRGNVRPDGIHFYERTGSWWPPDKLSEALQLLKKHLFPWFELWSSPARLSSALDTAIKEEKDILEIVEPLPDEATRAPWHTGPRPKRRIPPMYYYQASVLHYLNDDMEKAIARTKDWIASLSPHDEERFKNAAREQLAVLVERTRFHIV